MPLFINCVTALLVEMLYVDDTAMIAPINIMTTTEEVILQIRQTCPQTLVNLETTS
jgi:hypothetical protein